MKWSLSAFVVLVTLVGLWSGLRGLSGGAEAAASGSVAVTPSVVFLGRLGAGRRVEAEIEVTNLTPKPVPILGLKSSCGCSINGDIPKSLAPQEKRTILIAVVVNGDIGETWEESATLILGDEAEPEIVRIGLRAEICAAVEAFPDRIYPAQEQDPRVELRVADSTPFEILAVEPSDVLLGPLELDSAASANTAAADGPTTDLEQPQRERDGSSVTLRFSSARLAELGYPRRIRVFLDHEITKFIDIEVRRPRSSRRTPRTQQSED